MTQERLYTRDEVRQKFRVSYATLKQWRNSGTLPALKIGRLVRYKAADIEKVLTKSNRG